MEVIRGQYRYAVASGQRSTSGLQCRWGQTVTR